MAKIRLNGEVFDWRSDEKPRMSEALAIEEAYGRGYCQWQEDLAGGVLRAMCTLAWFVWRQNGRDVPIGDIMSDDFDFDFTDFLNSVVEAGVASQEEAARTEAGDAAVPTIPGPSPGPAGSPGTRSGTKGSSPSTSTSGRGKSRSSKPGNSSV